MQVRINRIDDFGAKLAKKKTEMSKFSELVVTFSPLPGISKMISFSVYNLRFYESFRKYNQKV